MVAPGNVNPRGAQAPPPPGQPRPIKAAGAAAAAATSDFTKAASPAASDFNAQVQGPEGGFQGTPRPPSAAQHTTDVLHQRRTMPVSPAKMAVAGVAFIGVLGYFTLYSKKKPEATALDVAKVTTGSATPENARPRK